MFVSDLHLSHEAPKARQKGTSWYSVMSTALNNIGEVKALLPVNSQIVYPGDIFHTPSEPVEVVNFALNYLPPGYGIPGNHDLAFHRYADVEKTPYFTLVKAGVIKDLKNAAPGQANLLCCSANNRPYTVYAYPYGYDPKPLTPELQWQWGGSKYKVHIAVIHKYIWDGRSVLTGHRRADERLTASKYQDSLKGYDFAVFGDNHRPFVVGGGGSTPTIVNCGTFIPRRVDERNIRSVIYIIQGKQLYCIELPPLRPDCWNPEVKEDDDQTIETEKVEVQKFVSAVLEANTAFDFSAVLMDSIDTGKLGESVKQLILKKLEEAKRDKSR